MTVKELVQEIGPQMTELRKVIHMHPELGFHEYETTKLIKSELTKEGIRILDYPLETGAIALIEGGHPGDTIALRADIDALAVTEETGAPFASKVEGLMHACGHDTHVATLLGVGKVLSRMKDQLHGKVLLVFQPAEETVRGALTVCECGMFRDYDVKRMVGLHCTALCETGKVCLRFGQLNASSSTLRIRVIGKSGHGAHPEKSVDPILVSAHILTALQTLTSRETAPVDTLVVSICSISGGTGALNVIPDVVEMGGTVRTLSRETLDGIEEKLNRMINGIAEAYGAKAEIDYQLKTPNLVNDDEVIAELIESLSRTLGAGNVEMLPEPSSGSEDFAEYSAYTKTGYFKVGSKGDDPRSHYPNHSSKVLQDERCILVGIESLANYALDTLGN